MGLAHTFAAGCFTVHAHTSTVQMHTRKSSIKLSEMSVSYMTSALLHSNTSQSGFMYIATVCEKMQTSSVLYFGFTLKNIDRFFFHFFLQFFFPWLIPLFFIFFAHVSFSISFFRSFFARSYSYPSPVTLSQSPPRIVLSKLKLKTMQSKKKTNLSQRVIKSASASFSKKKKQRF